MLSLTTSRYVLVLLVVAREAEEPTDGKRGKWHEGGNESVIVGGQGVPRSILRHLVFMSPV